MSIRKSFLGVAAATVAVIGSSACATKGYVRTQTAQVSTKVDSLTTSLEATQERTKQNEAKIAEVDVTAVAAQTSATSAGTAAGVADQKAGAADQKAGAADQKASAAVAKADAVELAVRRVVYEVVLSENQGEFAFGGSTLPVAVKTRIDALVAQIKADPKGAFFEIEGHTDNVGDTLTNDRIGLERANTVKRYLIAEHQIPLHRVNVISYGETKPLAPNTSRTARAQNRRVVIRVLA
jgi:peptidoglycan-associated lipoprotein